VDTDLIGFVQDMDRCWLEHRFDDLGAYLAEDIVIVAPGGEQRIEGREKAVESYRHFMERCAVERFDASGHAVTRRGDTAIVEYGWKMDWRDADEARQAVGREVLVLVRRAGEWRVVWRMQMPIGP